MPNPVTPQERAKIVALLKKHGGNRNKVSKLCKRAPGTVQTIANQEGIPSAYSAPKKAIDAKIAYAEERRLEIIGKGFDKANDLLHGIADAGELQKWSIALGTLVDKARLETGEATSRSEQVDPERRRKMKESLDELSSRRRARVAG
jgi:hypothetical protein